MIALKRAQMGKFIILSLFLSFQATSQTGIIVQHWVQEYQHRGRIIHDVVIDPSGNIHSAAISIPSVEMSGGVLFYSKIGKDGEESQETRVSRGTVSRSTIVLNRHGDAFLLYSIGTYMYYAVFGKDGTMKTKMSQPVSNHESGTDYAVDFDDDGSLEIFDRANSDLYWKIDRWGAIVDHKKTPPLGLRVPTNGFVAKKLDANSWLLVWHPENYELGTFDFDSIQTMIVGMSPIQIKSPVQSHAVKNIADAIIENVEIERTEMVRASDGAFLFIPVKRGEMARMYRIRFDKEGNIRSSRKNHVPLIGYSELLLRNQSIRLGKQRADEGSAERLAFFYGFTPGGELYYERTDLKLKQSK